MKQGEFIRFLRARGARLEQGKKHLKVYFGGKQSTVPRHPSHEIGEGLRKLILKQLGMSDR